MHSCSFSAGWSFARKCPRHARWSAPGRCRPSSASAQAARRLRHSPCPAACSCSTQPATHSSSPKADETRRARANQATPAEAQALFASFGGFWGSYKIDEALKKITYRAEGAINPNAMGEVAAKGDGIVRSFDLNGDKLVVTSAADSGDGRDSMRWTWERVPQLENLTAANRRLVGFWQHVVERRVNAATGAVLTETRRAPSIIVYTPSGYVGVHFPPMNRQRFAGAAPTDDEARAAIAGFVSYYGSYTLHPGIVFHHRLIILANPQGDSLKRFYEITNDEIMLKFPTVMNQGQEVRTDVTLKRLSGEKEMMGSR